MTANTALSKEQLDQFFAACAKASIQPLTVAKNAGVDLDNATAEDLAKLREAFNELKAFKDGK